MSGMRINGDNKKTISEVNIGGRFVWDPIKGILESVVVRTMS